MEKNKVEKKVFTSHQDAFDYYQKQLESYLELRLLSRHNTGINNFATQKKQFKKSIARALTYLNKKESY
jgi:hypothetical protein